MQRVMVVGGPGAGKSTVATELGRLTGLPVRYMDQIHYLSGWVERPSEEKDRLTRMVHAEDAWIFEGGHARTYDERAKRADTLVWLDLPLSLRFWRVVLRWVKWRGRTRPEMAPDSPERLSLEFTHYVLTSHRRKRRRISRLIAEHPHLVVHHLRSRGEVRRFLTTFP